MLLQFNFDNFLTIKNLKKMKVQLTADLAAEVRESLQISKPGEYSVDAVKVRDERIIDIHYRCDKENCNCVGGWWNWDKTDYDQVITDDDEIQVIK